MASVGNTYLSLADVFKRQDADRDIADIIEMQNELSPLVRSAVVAECNDGSTNLTTVRSGIPEGTWRMLYQGVQPSKSTTKQVRDTVGMAENWSEVDAKLVDLSKNPGKLRLTESQAFIEGLTQTMESAVFYGNQATDPEKFTGLAPRFNSTSAENGGQIVLAGGSGSDNTSVWFIVWGERTVHLLYPEGSKAGLQREDKGKTTKENSDGSLYDVYREKFTWDIGMTVKDWRYVVRIANIDVSDLNAGSVDLYKFFRNAYYKLYQRKIMGGKAAIYCNTTVMEALDALATADTNVRLSYKEVEGEEVLTYRRIPIYETDAILNTEAAIS